MTKPIYHAGVIVQPGLFDPNYTVFRDERGTPTLGTIEVSGPLLRRTFTALDPSGKRIGQTQDFEAAINLFTLSTP